ncbi:FtsZ-binding cell division protein ZapB [Psychroflexus sp. MBR-150]
MLFIVIAMSHSLDVVKQIEQKVFKLIKNHQALSEDYSQIKLENENLKEDIKSLKKSLEVLKSENEQLKTANAILGSNEFKRETKLKINRLIRDVDTCITQLSD